MKTKVLLGVFQPGRAPETSYLLAFDDDLSMDFHVVERQDETYWVVGTYLPEMGVWVETEGDSILTFSEENLERVAITLVLDPSTRWWPI